MCLLPEDLTHSEYSNSENEEEQQPDEEQPSSISKTQSNKSVNIIEMDNDKELENFIINYKE